MTANGRPPSVVANMALAAPMSVVKEPTFSVHMAGHLRLQVPCSRETQMMFDLMHPDAKMRPADRLEIKAESEQMGNQAAVMFNGTLQNSPQLKPITTQIGCSYAVIEGKLFYIYMLPVRSA